VGTGPYKVVKYDSGVRIELVRNPYYSGQQPAPDHIVIDINTNQQSLATDLLAGNIDAMESPPIEQFDQIKSAGFQIDIIPTNIYFYFNLNVTKAPTDELLVRQAMNYALDKEGIATLSKGGGTALYGAWFPGGYADNTNVPTYKYDTVKAGQLLDQAGWVLPPGGKVRQKNGQNLHVKLVSQTGTAGVEAVMTPTLISDLQAVGFEVESQAMDAATYISAQGAGNKDLANIAQFGQDTPFPDPQGFLDRLTTDHQPPNEFNLSFYSNPQYDQLVYAARTEMDEQKRISDLEQAQLILRNDAPLIWAVQAATPLAYSSTKFSSIKLFPNSTGLVDIMSVTYK
jgi:ABC-type transport system substrate-binding protein